MADDERPAESDPGSRARVPPRERFAHDAIHYSLKSIASSLRQEEPTGTGHRQIALYKGKHVTTALFCFEKDGGLKEHCASGTVLIQVVDGCLTISLDEGDKAMESGQLLVIASGMPHAVLAHEPTAMLLTVVMDRDH